MSVISIIRLLIFGLREAAQLLHMWFILQPKPEALSIPRNLLNYLFSSRQPSNNYYVRSQYYTAVGLSFTPSPTQLNVNPLSPTKCVLVLSAVEQLLVFYAVTSCFSKSVSVFYCFLRDSLYTVTPQCHSTWLYQHAN